MSVGLGSSSNLLFSNKILFLLLRLLCWIISTTQNKYIYTFCIVFIALEEHATKYLFQDEQSKPEITKRQHANMLFSKLLESPLLLLLNASLKYVAVIYIPQQRPKILESNFKNISDAFHNRTEKKEAN